MELELVTESHGPSGFMYAAIFHGHAGFSSAQFLRDELYKECVTALEGGALLESQDLSEAETAVTCAFLQADKRLLSCLYMSYWASCFLSQYASSVETVAVRNGNYRLEETQTAAEKESGSTATIMFVHSDRLLLAHVGDSRVVLSKGGKAVDLCSDHRPHGSSKSSIGEVRRIQAAVSGSLSVSCALGDVPFKSRKKSMMEEGIKDRHWTEAFASMKKLDGEWLVALVELKNSHTITTGSTDAVQFVQKKLKEHADAQRASEEIAREALMQNGQDNVSVIVVDFGYRTIHPLFLLQISQVLN
ncbi:unnamed protein product [Sphagnum jensenii]|uniref:PPM-type phosphatase domain-containing protein n=1 Tax=Sphagnum jensenii TaxID=128206 RepID=A0ABP0X5E8_9BRYO